ncbi:NrfD/PsrC family molybdoenzyme membrane anchor subunit [Varunaivibrio sulfuroxidans]|uniref:Molybdopterin-containing oxidoreductase family membrane subunit n=1 Tax=Varunaivibrio sulfuroxidans TaxID=1773489 RepID=A0A4R3J6G8_9PROT|nr:NrfD/PsrC family molybdoenzyme membrane anchor subunit [Varunaivibrio sulfuroxidans]TCS60924.1 molybdopterin-containing oxidoreductase family membrane subunit [Varunaivibrio sulfuroxidans]WES31668.1 polysulfide reductase NrfD [Varunaivibrio sulfuroxidans]
MSDPVHVKDINEDIAWAKINADVLRSMKNPRLGYWIAIAVSIAALSVGVAGEVYQYNVGMGPAGLNTSHMWDLYISSFVFWIGMSHSGTLLSAILHIVHADWRKPIYRFAEAMTTFSLLTAGLFPILHLGRVWNMHWVVPYFSDRGIWPNFTSPLMWDAFAITTYLISSALFLFVGMIPDLAICRDNAASGWRLRLYTFLALGWRGDDRQWRNFRVTYLVIACFLIPLAVSVHSIVAMDFSMSIMPGWHVTTFPPYFVAGALYSGCAAIISLFLLLRYLMKFEEYMTFPILDKVCKLTFVIAMVWSYLNLIEFASVWYGHDIPAKEVLIAKASGPYSPFFWGMIAFGMVLPFSLLSKKIRRSLLLLFVISLLLNTGMWLERWMIVTPTLSLGFHPFAWNTMWPGWVEWGIELGSFGWFGLLFLIFVKVFPSVSMYEVKEMVYHRKHVVFDDVEAEIAKLYPIVDPKARGAAQTPDLGRP